MTGSLLTDLGLRSDRKWWRDRWFYVAAAAAVPVVMALRYGLGEWAVTPPRSWALLLSFTIWQPAVEELLFRGVIQGRLRATAVGQWQRAGITGANLSTSALFVMAHLAHHTPGWALAALLPSLVFGWMRDRHGSVYPGFVLHCVFNGLYLLAGLP